MELFLPGLLLSAGFLIVASLFCLVIYEDDRDGLRVALGMAISGVAMFFLGLGVYVGSNIRWVG